MPDVRSSALHERATALAGFSITSIWLQSDERTDATLGMCPPCRLLRARVGAVLARQHMFSGKVMNRGTGGSACHGATIDNFEMYRGVLVTRITVRAEV
jgi:hypothetical protein